MFGDGLTLIQSLAAKSVVHARNPSTAVMLGFWAEEIHGVRDVLDNK